MGPSETIRASRMKVVFTALKNDISARSEDNCVLVDSKTKGRVGKIPIPV